MRSTSPPDAGRIVFVIVNLVIALVLMEADLFSFLNTILGFYANCAMAWIVTVATDINANKYRLKLSPKQPEFRRAMHYDWNPVGVVATTCAAPTTASSSNGLTC